MFCDNFFKPFKFVLVVLNAFFCFSMPNAWAQEPIQRQADVIIVGGGLAGLSAARTLVSEGLSVIVLEASNRIGGRTWTKNIPGGGWIDMGGQWVGPGMEHILPLAESLDVKTFPSYHKGDNILIYGGKQQKYSSDPAVGTFPISQEELKDYQSALKKIDAYALEVPVDAPWRAPRAKEWDSQTLATWIRDNVPSPGAKFILRVFALGYFAAEPSDISFLHFLFYIHAGGGFHKLHTSGVALRFAGGAQQISEKMANQLGDRVLLNMPVREIDQTGDLVVVRTEHDRFEAKQVIVAMAPPLAVRISYKPNLPANRDQFSQRTPMGSSIKVHAVYETAFWREKGLSGQVISEDDDVSLAVDNSPPDGKPGILAGFLEGQEAREWSDRPEAELKKKVLEAFVKFYGAEAATPVAFYKADWDAEPWARGCFTCVLPPGTWTGFPGVVREPVGRIHWAGTETATEWYAYMDGAVASGKRAAANILLILKKDDNVKKTK